MKPQPERRLMRAAFDTQAWHFEGPGADLQLLVGEPAAGAALGLVPQRLPVHHRPQSASHGAREGLHRLGVARCGSTHPDTSSTRVPRRVALRPHPPQHLPEAYPPTPAHGFKGAGSDVIAPNRAGRDAEQTRGGDASAAAQRDARQRQAETQREPSAAGRRSGGQRL